MQSTRPIGMADEPVELRIVRMELAFVRAPFGELALIAKLSPMVGHKHDDRVIGQVKVIDGFEESANPGIDQRATPGIEGPGPLDLRGRLVARSVGDAGMDEILQRAIVGEVTIGVRGGRIPQLVGHEAVDPEEERGVRPRFM